MTRQLLIQAEIVTGPVEAVLELAQAETGPMELELILLKEGMSESVTLRSSRGPSVQIALLSSPAHQRTRALVSKVLDDKVRFELPQNQVDYLEAVLLRAYRACVAEVNHIHIEGDMAHHPYDLTILFAHAQGPISAEDAAKLLGGLT